MIPAMGRLFDLKQGLKRAGDRWEYAKAGICLKNGIKRPLRVILRQRELLGQGKNNDKGGSGSSGQLAQLQEAFGTVATRSSGVLSIIRARIVWNPIPDSPCQRGLLWI